MDPVTAVATAVSELFGTIRPAVEEHYAQRYESNHKDRIRDWSELISMPDSDERGHRIGAFVRGMLDSAGTPTGQFSGTVIQVPVEILTALIQNTSESIRDDQRLARITFKTN